ncbi:EAL domain-containing protein [Oceanobacillus chungangensis]|uniref:Diguanylate phosphodiesterase n=1 Tax=Oceanobacillus chungangensis TaxID=1229152 RepID=A0A3D8PVT5_9BACI|nr:EAL-associated domain-containing protein [Oceanobacillus chungangensis]RDW19388.1 diguanylate phosphodiesterase [Oceanobacillus chungangensis]
MDPLKIMLQLEKVNLHYKPIISADTQLVDGYEVSAYFQENDRMAEPLDWFFEDASIPDDFRLELTHYIYRKSLEVFEEQNQSKNLSIFYDLRLLDSDNGQSLLTLLESAGIKGLDLSKIIIEIKEAHIPERIDDIRKFTTYLKTLGIKLALDVERRNGSLDRLAMLAPNMIKVDAGFLKEDSLPHLFQDVHHSLGMLSRKIGAALLFKGISSYNQLNYAWRNGGQYYQGSYLKQAQTGFVEDDCCQAKLNADFQNFVMFERKKVKAQLDLTNRINETFKTMLPALKPGLPYDEMICSIGKYCSDFVFRVYICNGEGIQLSSNAEKNNLEEWELHQEGRNKNWSWRPYFFENIMRMNVEKKGILSDLYTDIEKTELIRTYSYPISETLYVFLDIPYGYLYEQDGLL